MHLMWGFMLRNILPAVLDNEKQMKRSVQHREDIKKFLGPVIRERREAAQRSGYRKPDYMLQWMLEEFGIYGDEDMACVQLGVGMVSIHSTSLITVQV